MIVVAVLAGVLVAIAVIGTIVAVDRRRKRRDDHIDYRVVQQNSILKELSENAFFGPSLLFGMGLNFEHDRLSSLFGAKINGPHFETEADNRRGGCTIVSPNVGLGSPESSRRVTSSQRDRGMLFPRVDVNITSYK